MIRINNQKGFVSFITVIFLAGVLALITTAFVRAMTSNQRQTLDSQLNTQAFYAAESGINDVFSYIKSNGKDSLKSVYGSENCDDVINIINKGNPNRNELVSSPKIKYSCLLIDDKATSIEFDGNQLSGNVYALDTGTTLNSLVIEWGRDTQLGVSTYGNNLPEKSQWNSNWPAVLRVSLYWPGNNFSRDNLNSSQRTFFLVPGPGTRPGANINTGLFVPTEGSIHQIACGNPDKSVQDKLKYYRCEARLDIGFANAPGNNPAYIRINTIYDDSPVRLTVYSGSPGSPTSSLKELANAQFKVDVTGRANDVFKRVIVRKDIDDQFDSPIYVVRTMNSICKQYSVEPGGVHEDTGNQDNNGDGQPDCPNF